MFVARVCFLTAVLAFTGGILHAQTFPTQSRHPDHV